MAKNKICVYAICKNEEKFVDSWFNSMKEADFITVMDTGSTDGTFNKFKELEEKYPDKIYIEQKEIKPWRFDVARNESMKLIPEEYNVLVCTDLDEMFEEGWANILRRNWKKDTTRCFYKYVWNHTELNEPNETFTYDKIHTRDYHWIFPVHEVLISNEENFNQIAIDATEKICLHHYQDKTKPRKYYFDLLKIACEENPDNAHVRMLLAREYVIKKDNKTAIEEFLKVLKMPEIDAPERRLVLLNSLLQLAYIYEEEKNFDEAIWYCQEFIKEDSTYREPYFLMAEMYNLMNIYTLAETCAKAGFEYGTRKYDWVERGNAWLGWGFDLLGVAQFNLGKIFEATENTKIAVNHEPNDMRLLKNYIACLERKCEPNA